MAILLFYPFVFAGGNSGIGKESAVALAARGARVILACRDPDKAEKAVREIKVRSRSLNVLHMELDLANLRSVGEFCKSFLQREKRLDILINNAGEAVEDTNDTKDEEMCSSEVEFEFFLVRCLPIVLKATHFCFSPPPGALPQPCPESCNGRTTTSACVLASTTWATSSSPICFCLA